jgi:uncharacterized damage-inducible protein DinB
MPTQIRDVLVSPPGYRSREAGSFIAQLDELQARMLDDVKTATPNELTWQPATGTNTIGMLLAHIAIVEVFWTRIALGMTDYVTEDVLGVDMDHDGMPIASDAGPPAHLAGKDLAYFVKLVAKGREYLKRAAQTWTDEEMDGEFSRTRRDGEVEMLNRRWICYHLVEHLGGHYGQINLLRRLYRSRLA